MTLPWETSAAQSVAYGRLRPKTRTQQNISATKKRVESWLYCMEKSCSGRVFQYLQCSFQKKDDPISHQFCFDLYLRFKIENLTTLSTTPPNPQQIQDPSAPRTRRSPPKDPPVQLHVNAMALHREVGEIHVKKIFNNIWVIYFLEFL